MPIPGIIPTFGGGTDIGGSGQADSYKEGGTGGTSAICNFFSNGAIGTSTINGNFIVGSWVRGPVTISAYEWQMTGQSSSQGTDPGGGPFNTWMSCTNSIGISINSGVAPVGDSVSADGSCTVQWRLAGTTKVIASGSMLVTATHMRF